MLQSLNDSNLNPVLDRFAPLRREKRRFFLAAGAALGALALTMLAGWIFGSPAIALLAAAVAFSTALLGLAAGLCAAAVAVLSFGFVYTAPAENLTWNGSALRAAIGFVALAALTHIVERRISARIRSRVKPPLGVHGHFDGILEDGDVYGWALDADHPELPVTLTVLANNRAIATIAAVNYRPDVASRMKCSGQHGFYMNLGRYLPANTEAVIDIRLPNGVSLEASPKLARMPACVVGDRPTVLFMHIAKTAGTAFREAIATNFRESEIAYLYSGSTGFLVNDLRALPLDQRRAFRIVIGHFQYGMHEGLPQESEYITVVREPTARVWSQYAFLRQWQRELVTDSSGQLLSLEQVFQQRLTTDFDNTMVRCFSGVDERDFPPGTLNREIYNQAVHNLRTAFTFVGHQEFSAEAYRWLKDHYGWNAAGNLPSVNIGLKEQANRDEITGLDSVVRHYNQWDYLLYDEILRRFPQSTDPSIHDGA